MRAVLYMAIGVAAAAGSVPASFAQESRGSDHGKRAGTGSKAGISLAEPIGKISLNPRSLDGEPIYVRRTTVGSGITIVDVSTTPFMPVLAANETPGGTPLTVRPDQPAGW